ncbi:MAG: hypothetical protein U9Q06_02420 [Nanoarchaeota archaeon]|nr:hypothetical protein [Nanoarchaeota archaeon]
MKKTTIPIHQLQPSDNLRAETQEELAKLTLEEIDQLIHPPQVWNVGEFLLVSDGNNRIAHQATRGKAEVLVEYFDGPGEYAFLLDGDIKRARELRKRGIFTPYDLYKCIA